MKLRTEINIDRAPFSIDHGDRILSLGSCFSAHMSARLRQSLFHVGNNPFGTSYNPYSLAQQIERILSGQAYEPDDLEFHRDLYFSFDHYTAFSHPNRNEALKQINAALAQVHQSLPQTKLLLLTLGTAHAWKFSIQNRIVNNCHKLPGQNFGRVLLSSEEIYQHLNRSLEALAHEYPEMNVVITVSPVRHLRDGAVANQRSKSNLIVAAHQVADNNDRVSYFPAYELMMDDLRDYRFYADDLLHPSELAVDYIWQKFSNYILSESSLTALPRIEKITRFLAHRPQQPESEAYQKNAKKMYDLLQVEKQKLSLAQWDNIEQALNEINASVKKE